MGRHVIKPLIQMAVVVSLWYDAVQAVLQEAYACLLGYRCQRLAVLTESGILSMLPTIHRCPRLASPLKLVFYNAHKG